MRPCGLTINLTINLALACRVEGLGLDPAEEHAGGEVGFALPRDDHARVRVVEPAGLGR